MDVDVSGTQLHDGQFSVSVSPSGDVVTRQLETGRRRILALCSGLVAPAGITPIDGLVFYAAPCAYQSLTLRREASPASIVDRSVGSWPAAVDDDWLETYPHLHFLQERRTATPWRQEYWYTLAAGFLIFECEQYFERSCTGHSGVPWERFIARLRQVIELTETVAGQRPVDLLLVPSDDTTQCVD
jgi:hypothetical protein